MVFGEIGQGWRQVTSELAFETQWAGNDSVHLHVARHQRKQCRRKVSRVMPASASLARIAGLHQMSSAVAGASNVTIPADVAAAVVKVLGTTTEADIADFADLLGEAERETDGRLRVGRGRWTNGRASRGEAPTR